MINWIKNLFCKHEYVYIGTVTTFNDSFLWTTISPYKKEHYQCKKCLKIKKVEI
jgi:hypothetical protein